MSHEVVKSISIGIHPDDMERNNKKQMKIFILIDQLHTHGGIEKLVAQKANYWSDVLGYEVKIISTEQENQPFVYIEIKSFIIRMLCDNLLLFRPAHLLTRFTKVSECRWQKYK